MNETYACSICGEEFDSQRKRDGHEGGAHYREPTPIDHGTFNGYIKHVRTGVEPCQPCRDAHAQYQKDRRNRLKGEAE